MPPKKRPAFRDAKSRAKMIAKSYAKARDTEASAPRQIGQRKTLRIAIPPFRRAEATFKMGVYQLAMDLFMSETIREIEEYVRNRDERFRHKPRNPTAVDWAIRLVDRSPREARTLHGVKSNEPLLDSTFTSHLTTELNFAFGHSIKSPFVPMFIDHAGGYEIISAYQAAGEYILLDEPWVSPLRDAAFEREKQKRAEPIDAETDAWFGQAKSIAPSSLASPNGDPIILEKRPTSPAKPVLDEDEDWG